VLVGAGFEVQTASNAEEALELLNRFQPRAILMDLQLPGMDGLALTRLLKSDPAKRHIRVIALTAYAMKGDAERAFQAGCDAYLTKPIDIDQLPKIVAETIAGRSQT
jgi:CheY-like chemotaxis protein